MIQAPCPICAEFDLKVQKAYEELAERRLITGGLVTKPKEIWVACFQQSIHTKLSKAVRGKAHN